MAKERKLDIFPFLKQLSQKNWEAYGKLDDEAQKEVAPFVIMRWLTGVNDARQVFFLNTVVNPYAFTLQKHKELLVQLMTICTPGRAQRCKWIKAATKKKPASRVIDLVKQYFGYSSREAGEALPLLDNDTLLDYAKQLGYQAGEIKLLKKDLKKRA